MPSVSQIRTLLATAPNHVAAQALGCGVSQVQRWRTALALPPYPRGARGPGSTEQAILAALQPPGSWHPSASLCGLRRYDLTYALQRLCRKGLIQRRGQPRAWEYALTTTEE